MLLRLPPAHQQIRSGGVPVATPLPIYLFQFWRGSLRNNALEALVNGKPVIDVIGYFTVDHFTHYSVSIKP